MFNLRPPQQSPQPLASTSVAPQGPQPMSAAMPMGTRNFQGQPPGMMQQQAQMAQAARLRAMQQPQMMAMGGMGGAPTTGIQGDARVGPVQIRPFTPGVQQRPMATQPGMPERPISSAIANDPRMTMMRQRGGY